MAVDTLLVLFLATVTANVVLLGVAVIVWAAGRDRLRSGASQALAFGPGPVVQAPLRLTDAYLPQPERSAGSDRALLAAYGRAAGPDSMAGRTQPALFDRVIRTVAWTFILTSAIIVIISGLWPDTQTSILVLLAMGGFLVLIAHDLVPPTPYGPLKLVVEGTVALGFVTVLVMLTGGVESPFFFAYALVVAGAALVVSAPVTLILAIEAAAGFFTAILVGPAAHPLDMPTLTTIGIDLTALVLLAFVALMVAGEQRTTRDAAVRLSTLDPLTALYNRTFFFAAVDREIERSVRTRRQFCLLMADLDGLKEVNDTYGHHHGDRVLRAVAEVIRSGLRRIDVAARYAGDEFVVLLPETSEGGARVVAEKIREGVADIVFKVDGRSMMTSLSIGLVAYPDDGATSDALLIAADEAMYVSKRLGKNRVVGFVERVDDRRQLRGPLTSTTIGLPGQRGGQLDQARSAQPVEPRLPVGPGRP